MMHVAVRWPAAISVWGIVPRPAISPMLALLLVTGTSLCAAALCAHGQMLRCAEVLPPEMYSAVARTDPAADYCVVREAVVAATLQASSSPDAAHCCLAALRDVFFSTISCMQGVADVLGHVVQRGGCVQAALTHFYHPTLNAVLTSYAASHVSQGRFDTLLGLLAFECKHDVAIVDFGHIGMALADAPSSVALSVLETQVVRFDARLGRAISAAMQRALEMRNERLFGCFAARLFPCDTYYVQCAMANVLLRPAVRDMDAAYACLRQLPLGVAAPVLVEMHRMWLEMGVPRSDPRWAGLCLEIRGHPELTGSDGREYLERALRTRELAGVRLAMLYHRVGAWASLYEALHAEPSLPDDARRLIQIYASLHRQELLQQLDTLGNSIPVVHVESEAALLGPRETFAPLGGDQPSSVGATRCCAQHQTERDWMSGTASINNVSASAYASCHVPYAAHQAWPLTQAAAGSVSALASGRSGQAHLSAAGRPAATSDDGGDMDVVGRRTDGASSSEDDGGLAGADYSILGKRKRENA